MRLAQSIKGRLKKQILPQPIDVKHAEYSMLFSAEDEPAVPSKELIDIALKAIHFAKDASMESICNRIPMPPPHSPNIWPGECYKLLAGLTHTIQPKNVIEIGTGAGFSTLAIFQQLPATSKITTFDILPSSYFDENVLHDEDFKTGRLIHHLEDLGEPAVFEKHRKLFEEADFIYIDAAKDGKLEDILLDHIRSVKFQRSPLIAFDDIRLWNMLKTWREIPYSKLDLTSFGHWTGTGLVEWGKH